MMTIQRYSALLALFSFCNYVPFHKKETPSNAGCIARSQGLSTDTLVLYENKLEQVSLPFNSHQVYDHLANTFALLQINREMEFDPMDGGTFLTYSIYDKDDYLGEFYMEENDTLTLGHFESTSPYLKDQYGIRIGDTVKKINKHRNKQYTVEHNPWTGSFLTFPHSNIRYEIHGETEDQKNPALPATPVDPSMKDWTVKRILWIENK